MATETTELFAEPLRCRPGDVLILEASRPITAAQRAILSEQLHRATDYTGVKFVVLDAGLRVVRVERQEETA